MLNNRGCSSNWISIQQSLRSYKNIFKRKKNRATKYLQDITQCKRGYKIYKVILCYKTVFIKNENIHIYIHGKNTGMTKKMLTISLWTWFSFPHPTTLFLFSALILSQGLWIVTGLLWELNLEYSEPTEGHCEKSDKEGVIQARMLENPPSIIPIKAPKHGACQHSWEKEKELKQATMLLAKAFTMYNLWTPSQQGYVAISFYSSTLNLSFSFSLLLPVMCPSYFSLYLLLIWIFSEFL